LQEHVEQQWMALMMSLNESVAQAVPGAGIFVGGAIILRGIRGRAIYGHDLFSDHLRICRVECVLEVCSRVLSADGRLLDRFHGHVGKLTLNVRDLLIDDARQLAAEMRRLHAYVLRIHYVAVVKPCTQAVSGRPHVLPSGRRLKMN